MFTLSHFAACGMLIPIDDGDRDDIRRAAARLIRRRRRQGHPVTVVTRGQQWEIQENPAHALIPDAVGRLSIVNVSAECSECGQLTDTDRRTLSPSARRHFICSDCATERERMADEFAGDDDRDDDGGPWSGGFADNH